MTLSFAKRVEQWSSPPVDDVGYISSAELLTWDDEALLDLIQEFENTRYHGWRNWQGRWRDVLGLDDTSNKSVLEYGCGFGIEALQYARRNNQVSIADISADNLRLAHRVIHLSGYKTLHEMEINEKAPFLPWLKPETNDLDRFDVIHCAGVLHHIPDPEPVVEQMARWLKKDGELRLMVYSDEAWRIATQTEPPDEGKVEDYVEFDLFWKHWDPIGGYADWYSCQRLQQRFGKWFRVRRCRPLTQHGEYLGAVLDKR